MVFFSLYDPPRRGGIETGPADYAHARGRVNYLKTKNQKTGTAIAGKIPRAVLFFCHPPAAAE
jgi:hypothetical protein